MKKLNIYLAGDSTCAYNDISSYPQIGWGQTLHMYMTNDVIIHNHAMNGRSSKSFITEGRLELIENELQPGDLLLIQFGHNDQKEEETKRTDPYTSYQAYLTKYIEAARSKGATPILLTSLYRRFFDAGIIRDFVHFDFPEAMKDLAVRQDVPLIDVCQISKLWMIQEGEEATKPYFMHLEPDVYVNYPKGLQDNTHLRFEGAVKVAGFVAEGLKGLVDDKYFIR